MRLTKIARIVATAIAACTLTMALVGCGSSSSYQIAVPSDATNEARALLLLQEEGLITLSEDAGLTATVNDIVDNPYNIEIVEAEAASVPRMLEDVDFAVINGNYALGAELDPSSALASEDADSEAASEYPNVIATREDNQDSLKIQALVAAVQSADVQTFIEETYSGTVVSLFDVASEVPQAEGDDTVITVGASPTPHAEILNAAAPLLEAAGWTLNVVEYSDYVQPNVALDEGDLDANYFQHQPYLDNYNAENGTTLVGVANIHFESMALYTGKLSDLSDITG